MIAVLGFPAVCLPLGGVRVRIFTIVLSLVLTWVLSGAVASADPVLEHDTDDPVTAAPAVTRPDTAHCTVTLADAFRSNAADGTPQYYEGTLAPPKACPGPWAKVVMDQTVTVGGRQYDRIGDLRIGGTEVWWGTTEEPSGEGTRPITYHFDKDLTPYAVLLRTPQPFHGGIENYNSPVYTGVYAQTVTLTYYQADRKHPAPETADHVAGFGHADATPAAPTVHFSAKDLPRNITRAYLEVTLEGHACDEQWFDDVPDAVSAKYPAAGLCGKGPYREANFALDGTPAGSAFTFPHIYSGGIVPQLWRPIVAIDTFSLHAETYDITPFAGRLVDGAAHDLSFSFPDIGGEFTVVPTLLLYTDKKAARTSGALVQHDVAAAPVRQETVKDIEDGVNVTVTAKRHDVTAGYVDTSAGRVYTRVERTRDYRNSDDVTGGGFTQHVVQGDSGQQTSTSTVDGRVSSADRHTWSYPLTTDATANITDDQNLRISGSARMTQTLGDLTGDGRHWRPVRASTEWLSSSGVLARTNGVNTEADGRSRTSYAGTDDLGRPYFHYVASEHGLITENREVPPRR
ncbi:Peptide N-acetyl-beta-D-glucosaminyl asparaginase amidase A [Amycolatopsis pretoriensis]|uniref:Peptide N-acetyl-beta-D-glucosaminyl asparaginase amidase A n=1 Tax=Amycolatopsis pretoriensis TaxID=218821 RepID=A0A1H5Q393_9PSEU|nr:peptide-N4-asparagine amidase [Amycolatopsis pretoriensis]SEF20546.1 Peptide N-acetyl-beta-D-glucosaminyl asparaginase amidase A [Amycolatopsis pretoriensis]